MGLSRFRSRRRRRECSLLKSFSPQRCRTTHSHHDSALDGRKSRDFVACSPPKRWVAPAPTRTSHRMSRSRSASPSPTTAVTACSAPTLAPTSFALASRRRTTRSPPTARRWSPWLRRRSSVAHGGPGAPGVRARILDFYEGGDAGPLHGHGRAAEGWHPPGRSVRPAYRKSRR